MEGASKEQYPPALEAHREIRGYLDYLLHAPVFSAAPRRGQLLRYLVEKTLVEEGDQITEYGIGLDVFEKPPSFDPRIESSIRAEMSRLRRTLADYYAGPGSADPWRIEFRSRGYLPAIAPRAVQEGPPASAARPGHAGNGRNDAARIQHPNGSHSVLLEAPGPAMEAPAGKPAAALLSLGWRRVAAALLVSLAMLAAAIGLWEIPRPSSSHPDTLAILPFANLTANPANDYFSDGLADDLTATLGRIPKLRVISRASTFQFKNKKETPREIGRELGVGAILQGSVQRSGDQMRVVAELNSASDGSLIWSDVFDGNGVDALRLEDGIARAVAARMGDSVVPGLARRDPQVHDMYLRGRFLEVQQTPTALLQAAGIYRQALARDPRDPECNAALASTELYLANLGQMPPEEADREARPLLQKALEADPSSGEVQFMLAGLLYMRDHNWPAAEAGMKKAVELSPNSPGIRNNYGYLLMYRGRFEEAEVQFARGGEIDPLNVIPHFNMGSLHAFKRDFPRAETEFRTGLETSPKNLYARVMLADVLAFEGKYDAAYEELDRARALMVTPDMAMVFRAIFLARQGKRAEARDVLAGLRPAPGTYYQRAIAYMELGDRDSAFRYLEQAYQAHEGNLVTLSVNLTFASAHSDPRLQDLLRRLGAW